MFEKPFTLLDTNYSNLIPSLIIVVVIISGSLIISYFIIHAELLIILLFLFILPLFFIVRIEKLFICFIALSFIPFEFTFGGVEGWEIKDFLIPIFLLLFVGRSVIKKEALNRNPRFSFPLLLFLLIVLVHLITLEGLPKIIKTFLSFAIPAGGLRFFYSILICSIVYYLIPFAFKKESHIELFLKLLGGACIFLIIFSFIRIYLGIGTIFPNEAYSTIIHYVSIGESSVPRVGIMGVAGYFLFTISLIFVKSRSNILFLFLTIISIAAVVQSGGRAMFLGLVFATSLYLYLSGKKFKAAILPVGLFLVLLFIGMNPKIINRTPPILYRYLTIFSSENPSFNQDGNTRSAMVNMSWEIISKNPLWGARSVDSEWKYNRGTFDNVIRGSAHNAYLATAATFGLPALAIWLIVAVSYFKKIIYLYRKTNPASLLNNFCLFLAVLLGVLFLTFFLEGGAGGGFKYFMYLGLIDSAWNMFKKNQTQMINHIN